MPDTAPGTSHTCPYIFLTITLLYRGGDWGTGRLSGRPDAKLDPGFKLKLFGSRASKAR